MGRFFQIGWVLVLSALWGSAPFTQSATELRTADTVLHLEAGENAPRLVSLQTADGQVWNNRAPEVLIESAEIDGKSTKIRWEWNRAASHADFSNVEFVYESSSPKLRLTWRWKVAADFGPIEHSIQIANEDSRVLWIPLQDSIRFDWQSDAHVPLEQMYIEKGANTPSPEGTHLVKLEDGYSWEGTSSTYSHPRDGQAREIIPWFLVQTAEGGPAGWYVGIEFSGRTHLTLSRKGDSLAGTAGLNPNPSPFRTRLNPGETFETPTVFLGGSTGGTDAAGNVLRRWVRQVLTNPLTWQDPHYPWTVNNSWGGGMAVNEEVAGRMIRDAADLGLEMFHADAGWFRGVGDWYPNLKKFPRGLAVVADDAHRHGLKFGLWVDWTQAAFDTEPGALNARDPKVRDWMVTDLPDDWQPEPFKGQTIDLGVPAAKAWADKELNRIVTDYHLDMLEHDGYLVAQGCDRSDHPHAPPDRWNMCVYKDWGSYFVDSSNSTDVSYHAVRAYYDIYAKLRREHPGLLFEICDDGGRMLDFGSAAHGDYFSITDTYDPLSNRRAFYDTSHLLPAAMLESYVERWPTPNIENFRYMLRSGMMGWLTIMIDTSTWTPEQHAAAKQEVALYKSELRPLIRDADLYHISERPDGVHWDGMEYFDGKRGTGVVYAFRGSTQEEGQHAFVLRGLNPGQQYNLHFQDQSSADRTVSGKALLEQGLTVELPGPYSSELVFLKAVLQ